MTTQPKICEAAQRHNFTNYLNKGGNANVYSRLLSVGLQQQLDNIVHLGVREMQAVFMKVVTHFTLFVRFFGVNKTRI